MDSSGKRRAKQFDRRCEAEAYLLQVRGDLARGLHVAPGASPTIADVAAIWIQRCDRDRLERSTTRQYRSHLKNHILPICGKMKLSDMTSPRAHALVDELLKTRSHAMTRKVLSSLSSIFEEATKRGLASHNPIASIRVRTPSDERHELEMPTRDELRAMLHEVHGRWRPLVLTAIFTGMRSSELRGLRWEDVDFAARAIRVRQRADAWGHFGPPKSKAGKRDIPMSPTVVNTLKEWKLRSRPNALNLVFPTRAGKPMVLSSILRYGFRPLHIKAGVVDADGKPKYGFHALRHAAASLFIEQGLPPKRIQAIMGHATISMTFDVYGYLFPNEAEDQHALAQIESRLLK
jgi:integrase